MQGSVPWRANIAITVNSSSDFVLFILRIPSARQKRSHVCDRPALLAQIVRQDGAVRPDGMNQVGGSHIYEYRPHPLLMLRELQQ